MDVRNCQQCGQIFAYISKPICPKCVEEDEQIFLKVKGYLVDNPGANIEEICNATEISEKKVISYLREGRLQLTPGQTGIVLRCERCQETIYSGRYCEKCVKDIKKEFTAGFGDREEERGDGKDSRRSVKDKGTVHLRDRFSRNR